MKSIRNLWNSFLNADEDEELLLLQEDVQDHLELGPIEGEGAAVLEEAYDALNKLSQKTHTRGKPSRQPKRADNWQ